MTERIEIGPLPSVFWVNIYACVQRLALSVCRKHDAEEKADHWMSAVRSSGEIGPLYRVKVVMRQEPQP